MAIKFIVRSTATSGLGRTVVRFAWGLLGLLWVPLTQAQAVHSFNVTTATPLQIPGIKWGMSKESTSKTFRSFSTSRYGLPYYNLMDIEFEVDAEFDALNREYQQSAPYGLVRATRRRISSGLNGISFYRWKGCYEEDYFRLRKVLLNKLEVYSPEKVTGETEMKTRTFGFILPNAQGYLFLTSRCDAMHEEGRWLFLEFTPGGSDEPADCRDVPTGTRWVSESQEFYESADAHGVDRAWARINARGKLPYMGNYCRKLFSEELSAKTIRNVQQIGGTNEPCNMPRGNEWSGYDVTCHKAGKCQYERAETKTEVQCE